jgi:pyroglutamyl-peptidase
MLKLLLTGFKPFLNYDKNPTEQLVKNLDGLTIGDFQINSWVFNVDYQETLNSIPALLEEINPDLVLNLGLAGERFAITPEKVALNYIDSKNPDNAGNIIQNQKIKEDGENAYFTKIKWDEIIPLLKDQEVPCELSTSAGTYVCNQVSYLFNYEIEKNNMSCAQSFIHVPNNLDPSILEKALKTIIQSIKIQA